MPVDLCSLILECSGLSTGHILARFPTQFHTVSLLSCSTPSASGRIINLAHRLPRSSMHPLSALDLQSCINLNLTGACVGEPYPHPQPMALPHLTSLSLSRARITTQGALPFLSSLLSPSLKQLDLSYLHLKPQMYAALATSVASLTELTHINLAHHQGTVQGTLYSKLLAPLFSAASQIPALCCLAGASMTGLGCVPDTVSPLSKLPDLSIDYSDCSTALGEKLSAAAVPLLALSITLPPFLLGSDSAQVCLCLLRETLCCENTGCPSWCFIL